MVDISNCPPIMTTIVKPKERQFQVVPVPAIFTRGRWECRDFKETPNYVATSIHNHIAGAENAHGLADYIEKPNNAPPPAQNDVPSTIPLMRNDVKDINAAHGGGVAAVAAILPEILPSMNLPTNVDSVGGTLVEGGTNVAQFLQQATPQDSDISKEGMSGIANQVGIDNKIEQAMDLVKSHLTFAVREEVEQLRTQISELESRVNNLEGENQILRQFAPQEIVTNLPLLLTNNSAQINAQQQLQHKSSAKNFENANTLASIPSVSSAPILTTMAGLAASTALVSSNQSPAITHTISTSQPGGVTLHIGATPSPPQTVGESIIVSPTNDTHKSSQSFSITSTTDHSQLQSQSPQHQQMHSNFVVTSSSVVQELNSGAQY